MSSAQNDLSSSYENTLKECSNQLIMEDGKTIIGYIQAINNNGLITLSLLPYLALYCRSAQEFLGKVYIENEIDKQFSDMRNGIKIFSDRFKKGKEVALHSDKHQNDLFKNMLRFPFMKSWNIHYNLGVYFDIDGNIIGNTQIMNYFLNSSYANVENQKEHAFQIGMLLAETIVHIVEDVCNNNILPLKGDIYSCPKCGYMDINTNKSKIFFNNRMEKEYNLIFLHILSSIGFVRHILHPILPTNNLWKFRIEYIVAHYAWSGLKRVSQHLDSKNDKSISHAKYFEAIVSDGINLFPSVFRNCMVHYDLFYNDKVTIFEKNYSIHKPFYGLIESCFDGKSFNELSSELNQYLADLEMSLSSLFHYDISKIKWDI